MELIDGTLALVLVGIGAWAFVVYHSPKNCLDLAAKLTAHANGKAAYHEAYKAHMDAWRAKAEGA